MRSRIHIDVDNKIVFNDNFIDKLNSTLKQNEYRYI